MPVYPFHLVNKNEILNKKIIIINGYTSTRCIKMDQWWIWKNEQLLKEVEYVDKIHFSNSIDIY